MMMTHDELRREQAKADAGDQLAQYRVAMHHRPTSPSSWVNSDFEKYLKLSAEQGYLEAQLEYASYLELKSDSSRENIIEAIRFYYLAALQGDISAITKLQIGLALHTKLDNLSKERVSSSYFSWSNSASVQTKAIYWLGKLFASDFLLGKNTARAIEFYTKAVEQKYPLAGNELAKIYAHGLLGVMKNQAYAIQLLKSICDEDRGFNNSTFAESHYLLGTLYQNAEGAEKDIAKAIKAYEKADSAGHKGAALQLGHIYRGKAAQGRKEKIASHIVNQYKDKALEYYKKNANDKNTQNFIGLVYDEAGDYPSAVFWYEKSANQGLPVAQCNLAITYDTNASVKNERKAVFWYKKAAENGYANAQYKLAVKYESGVTGVLTQDMDLAKDWYKKAADQGHVEAKAKLEAMHKSALLEAMNHQNQDYLIDSQEYLEKYAALEKTLGYEFEDPYELFNAFDRNTDSDTNEPYFQPYEFLGDGILNAIIRRYLFQNKPDSMKLGVMEKIYQDMVKNKDAVLLEVAKKLNLSALIIKSKDEARHMITDKMLADHLEALIAAISEDSDFEEAEKFVIRMWQPSLDAALANASVVAVASAISTATAKQALASSSPAPKASASITAPAEPAVISIQRQTSAGSIAFYNRITSLTVAEMEKELSAHPNRANACSKEGKQVSVLAALVNLLISANEKKKPKKIEKINTLIRFGALWDLPNKKGQTPRELLTQVPAEVRQRLTMK